MTLPCDCCPTSDLERCALTGVQFTGVAQTSAQAGWNQVNLPLTIDGVTATTALSGYNSPASTTASTTVEVTYTHTTPQNGVRGLRLWNQGGGVLTDGDGLGAFTADFYAGATLLATLPCAGANGGTPFTFLLPAGVVLNGVDRVVLRNLGKLTASSVAPLWRELQLLEQSPVFPCRRRGGALEWYDLSGNLVANADVVACDECALPFTAPALHMAGTAFNDAPNEFICNVAPAPSATVGWTVAGACFDPNIASPSMDWTNVSGVELEYGSAAGVSGGVIIQFSSPSLGTITWPTNLTEMAPGERRLSNALTGGRRAILTYVSGPPQNSPSGTVRTEGGANIGLHRLAVSTVAPIRFRIDLYTNACV